MNPFERKSIASSGIKESMQGQITRGLGQVPVKTATQRPSIDFKRNILKEAAAGSATGGAMGAAAKGLSAAMKNKQKKK